jgi:hypothetical protein
MSLFHTGWAAPGTLMATGRFLGAMLAGAQPNGRGPVDAALDAQAAR